MKRILYTSLIVLSSFYLNAQINCPGYGASIGSTEVCEGQNYSITVPNTACSGEIFFDVKGNGDWYVKSNLTGTILANGGAGGTFGPFDPNTQGNIFDLIVSNGVATVSQNGETVAHSTGGHQMFPVNISISAATIKVTTPSGIVEQTVNNCNDFFVQVPLVNTNFCTTLEVVLPWVITCNSTASILGTGTRTVTVYPQTPADANDLVSITWDAVSCTWNIAGNNDCDLLDIGTIFDISPNPSAGPNSLCNDGTETFTVSYNGFPEGPNCCSTAGAPTPIKYDQSVNYHDVHVVTSPFGGLNNAAHLQIPPNGTGGNATAFNLCLDVAAYCRQKINATDGNSFWVFIFVDNEVVYSSPQLTGNSHNICLSIADLTTGYNQTSVIDIYVLPNTLSAAGTNTTFRPSKTCTNLLIGEWTAKVEITDFDVTFERMTGSPVSCESDITSAYVSCPGPDSPTNITSPHPAHPNDYCPGNKIELHSVGGTPENTLGTVDVWYAASGQTAAVSNDCQENFVELWNSFGNYEPSANDCYFSHNSTNYNVSNGVLELEVTNSDPFISMYPLPNNATIDANTYKYINVRYKVNLYQGSVNPSMGMLFTKRTGPCGQIASEYGGVNYPFVLSGQSGHENHDINTDGSWHVASFPMHTNPNWNGAVTGLRLDYFDPSPHNANIGSQMEVDFITVSKHPMVGASNPLVLENGNEHYPTTTTTYYTKKLGKCGSDECVSTTIIMQEAGTTLASNGEFAQCYVELGETVHFYNKFSKKYVTGICATTSSLGKVDATVFVEATVPTYDACGNQNNANLATSVLQRHWTISPTVNVQASVILPYNDVEFSNLQSTANSNANVHDDINSIADIKLSKYSGIDEDNLWDNNCVAGQMQGVSSIFSHIIYESLGNPICILPSPITSASYVRYDITGFSEFWLHGSDNDSPLPVELSHFATSCDKNVVISWATESELNSEKFIVEKSRNGVTWEIVGTVKAAGSSNFHIAYSLNDNKRYSGISYYRLRQIDYNGLEEIYGPLSVSCDQSGNSMVVYPNPNSGNYTVEISSSEEIKDVSMQLSDITGKVISSSVIQIPNGVLQIPVGENKYLSTGTYVLRLLNTGSYFEPVKVVVK